MQASRIQSSLRSAGRALAAHRLMARQFGELRLRLPVTQQGKRAPIVFYSQVAWDTVWQRPQEQAIGLSKYRTVVFISPVQLHELTSRLWDRWQLYRRLEGGRLHVISPLIFSGEYRNPSIRNLNRQVILRVINTAVYGRHVLLTNSPFAGAWIDKVSSRTIAYDLIDDFCAFGWAPAEAREWEDRLVAGCALGFAGTGHLQEKYADRLQGLEFLPSGVQFERMTAGQEEPAELDGLPHPRILYVGTLNDRLNGELFRVAAEANPRGSIVVVGPRHGSFACPELPRNVHFLGLQPHERLPGFYQHCDLGIMPFADNDAARAINPVKTLEYLACGLPVLSTPVPDVIKYYPGVVRVEAPEGWSTALIEMLTEGKELRTKQRREFARDRSWDRLVRRMEQKFRELEQGA